ncbi:uncharacterized protein [Euphorbia lathyris]
MKSKTMKRTIFIQYPYGHVRTTVIQYPYGHVIYVQYLLFPFSNVGTEDLDENQFSGNHENAKIEKDNQEDTIFQENMEISSDQDGQIGKEHGLEDASPHDVDGESMSNIDLVNRERELNIPVPLGVDGVVDTQISGGFQ